MVNRHILVIDDDDGVRQSYIRILSPKTTHQDLYSTGEKLFGADQEPSGQTDGGFQVTAVANGTRGIEAVRDSLARHEHFAAAFIDMKMPGISGAETARQIWNLDPNIKIAIVTAYSESSPEEITRIIGRRDLLYLRKPFNSEEIHQLAVVLTQHWQAEYERNKAAGQLEKALAELAAINKDLNQKVKQQTALLIQSEKMSSIGILAAGVAHEINNPLAYINTNLGTMKEYVEKLTQCFLRVNGMIQGNRTPEEGKGTEEIANLKEYLEQEEFDFIFEDISDLVEESLDGVRKVKEIVDALRSFSHAGHEDLQMASINDLLEDTIKVAWNQIKYKTSLVREYDEKLPLIECHRQNLGQVFMNLLMNAAQAFDKQGNITIRTNYVETGRRSKDRKVEIHIIDDGPGMPPDVLSKIFDPFFTTKPVGTGTGLGLSISYDIIQKHGGQITVESQPGAGTSFHIQLPAAETS